MHDFCFTPLYSVFLVLCGLLAWASKGSVVSLVAATGAALVTGGASYFSFTTYMEHKKKCLPAVYVSLAVALAVGLKMGSATMKNPNEHVVQGIMCIASLSIASFYLWNLIFFRIQPRKPNPAMDINQLKIDAAKYAELKRAKAT